MNQDEQQLSGVLRQTVIEVSSCFRTASWVTVLFD